MLGACKDNLKYRITFKWRIGRQKRARSCFSEVLFMSKSFASRISRELREEKWASGRRNNKKKTIEIWVTMARNLWSLGSGCMFAGREWEYWHIQGVGAFNSAWDETFTVWLWENKRCKLTLKKDTGCNLDWQKEGKKKVDSDSTRLELANVGYLNPELERLEQFFLW